MVDLVGWDEYLIAQYPGATVIAPNEVDFHDRIHVPGWFGTCLAIDYEDMGDGWVKVLWEVFDHNSPGPYTMFHKDERLVRL